MKLFAIALFCLHDLWDQVEAKNYSNTQEGTKTAFRGKKAHQSISREIVELCEVIEINSKMSSPDGRFKGILFGDLFNIYNSISNKVR